jgi:hypothetical protein
VCAEGMGVCSYMGDQAIIDKQTGEVLSFRPGPK